MLVSIVVQQQWYLLQLDINNAFLNVDLNEKVYMELLLSYLIKGEQFVFILNKFIYDLRQALHQWYYKISNTIVRLGFK